MKKVWVLILLASVFITATLMLGWNWFLLRQKVTRLQRELLVATIVGQAYEVSEAKDWVELYYGGQPAKDAIVELYRSEKQEPRKFEDYILAATTKVDSRGQYKFRVVSGKYWVSAKTIDVKGVRYLPETSGFEVGAGEVIVGPALLFELGEQ